MTAVQTLVYRTTDIAAPFEYKSIAVDPHKLDAEMNALTPDGWSAIMMAYNSDTQRMVVSFVRQKQDGKK